MRRSPLFAQCRASHRLLRLCLAAALPLAVSPFAVSLAHAADGFTQSAMLEDAPPDCRWGEGGEEAGCRTLAQQQEAQPAEPDDDAAWQAWWRGLRDWSPFAAPPEGTGTAQAETRETPPSGRRTRAGEPGAEPIAAGTLPAFAWPGGTPVGTASRAAGTATAPAASGLAALAYAASYPSGPPAPGTAAAGTATVGAPPSGSPSSGALSSGSSGTGSGTGAGISGDTTDTLDVLLDPPSSLSSGQDPSGTGGPSPGGAAWGVIPEPASLALIGGALVALGLIRRRRAG